MTKAELIEWYISEGYKPEEAEEELRLVAIHEAGHFVMNILTGGRAPGQISLVPNETALGWLDEIDGPGRLIVTNVAKPAAVFIDKATAKTYARHSIAHAIFCLGGGCAVGYFDNWNQSANQNDLEDAEDALVRVFGDQAATVLKSAKDLTSKLVSYKRVNVAIQEAASWLMQHIAPDREAIACYHEHLYHGLRPAKKKADARIDELADRHLPAVRTVW